MRALSLLFAVSAILLCGITRVDAATFVVDTTSDVGLTACTDDPADCSLRGAMSIANTATTDSNIHFNIPMTDPGCVAATGVCTIGVNASPPLINFGDGAVVIDGYTQPGALANTLSPDQGGSNAQLKIVVSAAAQNITTGFRFDRRGTLRGLVINGFQDGSGSGTAVNFSPGGFQSTAGFAVEGCFIGTDVTGMIAAPNNFGITFNGNPFGGATSVGGRIGGLLPAQRNVISGNTGIGIYLAGINHSVLGNLIGTNAAGTVALGNKTGVVLNGGTNFVQFVGNATSAGRNVISGNTFEGVVLGGGGGVANGHRIIGNYIGTDVTGTLPLGNGALGVSLGASNAAGPQPPMVGGTQPGEGNIIAFNGTQGVATRGSRGEVIGNRIYANGQLGISSRAGDNGTATGRRTNDPGDADNAANQGQNFPELTAYAPNGSSVDLGYGVDSAPANSVYPLHVEFFKADGDEGRDLIGVDEYLEAEAQTTKQISLALPVGMTLGANDVIVATATDADGNTSEFSYSTATLVIHTPVVVPCLKPDSVFCSGFELGENASLLVTVTASATSGPFTPSGVVDVNDNRGGACSLTLGPGTTPLSSQGTCMLIASGAPGTINISAGLNTFKTAFGNENGGSASASTNFVIDAPDPGE